MRCRVVCLGLDRRLLALSTRSSITRTKGTLGIYAGVVGSDHLGVSRGLKLRVGGVFSHLFSPDLHNAPWHVMIVDCDSSKVLANQLNMYVHWEADWPCMPRPEFVNCQKVSK